MLSRNGKEFTNFGHIQDEIPAVVKQDPTSLVLDGEVMSENFPRSNETGTQKRKC